jgi:hypothetical protein
MNIEEKMEGGCLCGAVRYSISGTPFAAEYCHCRMCQKSAGAVVVNWMDFHKEQVTWTIGKPSEHESSETVRRAAQPLAFAIPDILNTGHSQLLRLMTPVWLSRPTIFILIARLNG